MLVLQHVGGNPPFALLGQRIVGAGDRDAVCGRADGEGELLPGRPQARGQDRERPSLGNGAGQFHVSFVSAYGGLVQARAAHYATAPQGAFSGRSAGVRFVTANVGPGARGPVGAAAAVRARRAALRGAAERGVRRRHGTGADRLPQDDRLGAGAGRRQRRCSSCWSAERAAFTCATAATAATSRQT